jgi:hypothetical protein
LISSSLAVASSGPSPAELFSGVLTVLLLTTVSSGTPGLQRRTRVVPASTALFQVPAVQLGSASLALALVGCVVSGTADQRYSACQQQTNHCNSYNSKLLHLLPPSN